LIIDEHFTPTGGLDLDDYVARGESNAVWHLIRYLWAAEVLGDWPETARVLDLGCGAGYGTYLLALRHPGISFLGVDYDPAAVEAARAAYVLPNLRFAPGDATQWEATIGRERYDCVVAFDSIEHVVHRELMLQEVVEHLEERGRLLLSTPCAWASPILAPSWEFHRIEYSLVTLYDFLRRYFGRVRRPDDGTLPRVEVFDRLRGSGMEYLLLLNPVVCEVPIVIPNPYRPRAQVGREEGRSGVRAVAGDWGGWGRATPGVVDVRTGMAMLTQHPTAAAIAFETGLRGPDWEVVAGDWDGRGVDTLGLVNPATGEVVLLERNAPDAPRRWLRVPPAEPGWLAVAGDWDGDGRDALAFFHPPTRVWRLQGSGIDGPFDREFFFGPHLEGLVPLAGAWTGGGADGVGVYSPQSAAFYLRAEVGAGEPDVFVNFGVPGGLPVAGDWDGDGVTTFGVCNLDDRQFYLRNAHAPGDADLAIWLPAIAVR
jgi:SAM-dependent methyltransferase